MMRTLRRRRMLCMMAFRLLLLLCSSSRRSRVSDAFPFATTTTTTRRLPVVVPGRGGPPLFLSSSSNYGKGAEMWPPGLEDDTVMDLRDSFPHGKVPPLTPVTSLTKKEQEEPLRWSNLLVSKQGNRLPLLRRAARSQEDEEQRLSEEADGGKTVVPQLLMLAATLLVTVRHLQPVDYLLVTAVTGYLVVLQKLAAQQRQRTTSSSNLLVPVLPALPPQGHVPVGSKTPLGYALTQSRDYRRWLRLGEVLGWWAPMLLLGTTQLAAATATALQQQSLVARPLFFLAGQAVTERRVTRRWTTPLPIRILVPVLYNWIRLGYLWKWATSTTAVMATTAATSTTVLSFRSVSQWLAVANWAYTAVNLWGFLIPVATLRYLRAHFWGVEAARVVTRRGLTGGLLMDNDDE